LIIKLTQSDLIKARQTAEYLVKHSAYDISDGKDPYSKYFTGAAGEIAIRKHLDLSIDNFTTDFQNDKGQPDLIIEGLKVDVKSCIKNEGRDNLCICATAFKTVEVDYYFLCHFDNADSVYLVGYIDKATVKDKGRLIAKQHKGKDRSYILLNKRFMKPFKAK
jgi:hypothetical protein